MRLGPLGLPVLAACVPSPVLTNALTQWCVGIRMRLDQLLCASTSWYVHRVAVSYSSLRPSKVERNLWVFALSVLSARHLLTLGELRGFPTTHLALRCADLGQRQLPSFTQVTSVSPFVPAIPSTSGTSAYDRSLVRGWRFPYCCVWKRMRRPQHHSISTCWYQNTDAVSLRYRSCIGPTRFVQQTGPPPFVQHAQQTVGPVN